MYKILGPIPITLRNQASLSYS